MVITNSVQNIKERCKTGAGANTNLKIGSRIRRYGGKSIYADRSNPPFIFCRNLENEKIRTRDYILGDHD